MLLFKSIQFKNEAGQHLKVTDIPVLGRDHHNYFMIQTRLQTYISSLYSNPQDKDCHSFREYLKRKMKWIEFKELF